MKVLLISAVLAVALCAASPVPIPQAPAAPAAPEEWRPSGRLILLPARLEAPAETPQADEPKRVLDSGEYYVLLEDGRLQMVKYTTAALTDADKSADKNYDKSTNQQAAPAPAPFAQFQVEYYQFPGQPQQQEEQQSEQKSEQQKQQQNEQQFDFEANLQYRDVKPISAPIYAYNSAPLVRILKK